MQVSRLIGFASVLVSVLVFAAPPVQAGFDNAIFNYGQLDIDGGDTDEGGAFTWEGQGWIGTDFDKFWVKTEGERVGGNLEEAEVHALYSRMIAPFWDLQVGLRHDFQPDSVTYGAVGFQGLAPYFFDVDISLFVADDGNVSLRTEGEYEILLTQRFYAAPYIEANWFLGDEEGRGVGSGLGDIDAGVKWVYEIRREFAPYLDFNYVGLFGETKDIAKNEGEDTGDFVIRVCLRLLF